MRHKYASYYAGIVASTLLNVKMSSDSTPISAYDFVPRVVDPQQAINDKAYTNLFSTLSLLSDKGLMPADITELRARSIQAMRDEGVEDPEGIFTEVFESHDNAGNK